MKSINVNGILGKHSFCEPFEKVKKETKKIPKILENSVYYLL